MILLARMISDGRDSGDGPLSTPGQWQRVGYPHGREILAQGKMLELLGHVHPAQVGMPLERDAEHVERFTLVPVRRRPDAGDAVHDRRVRIDGHTQPHIPFVRQRVEVIDHLEPLLRPETVHRRDVDGHVHRDGVLKGLADRRPLLGLSGHGTILVRTSYSSPLRWPGRRRRAVFEPRSNTTVTNRFQGAMEEAFSAADEVFIGPVHRADAIPESQRLDTAVLTKALMEKGIPARAFKDVGTLAETLIATGGNRDVVLIMSNGAFGGLYAMIQNRFRKDPGMDISDNGS